MPDGCRKQGQYIFSALNPPPAPAARENIYCPHFPIGRDPNTARRRRRECPDFARRFEAALGDAEVRLEYALVEHANNLVDRAADALDPPRDDAEAGALGDTMTPVEASFALQVVKWLDARKAGKRRGARRYRPKEPDIAEVRADILRKIEAIERHRSRAENGDSHHFSAKAGTGERGTEKW
jgi:hypothetical protein